MLNVDSSTTIAVKGQDVLWDYVKKMETRFDRKLEAMSSRIETLIQMMTKMRDSKGVATPSVST